MGEWEISTNGRIDNFGVALAQSGLSKESSQRVASAIIYGLATQVACRDEPFQVLLGRLPTTEEDKQVLLLHITPQKFQTFRDYVSDLNETFYRTVAGFVGDNVLVKRVDHILGIKDIPIEEAASEAVNLWGASDVRSIRMFYLLESQPIPVPLAA